MKNDMDRIGDLFLDVISGFYEGDRRARTFGTGTELYHSEIHMIQCIADNPELHISALARKLGITRGAASQTVKRLERKQMAVKQADPANRLRIVMSLTAKGKIACRSHRRAHERYKQKIAAILAGAGADRLKFLTNFLVQFGKALKAK